MLTFVLFFKFMFNIIYTPIPYSQPAPLYIVFYTCIALLALYFLLFCVNTRMLQKFSCTLVQ